MHTCDDHAEIPKVTVTKSDDETAVSHVDPPLLEFDPGEHEGELGGKKKIRAAGVHSDDWKKV